MEALLPAALPPAYRADWDASDAAMRADGVPEALARRLANTRALGAALDIADLSLETGVPLADVAAVYFGIGERFRILWLFAAVNELPVSGKWPSLARVNLRDDVWRLHRRLAAAALAVPADSAEARLAGWVAARDRAVRLAQTRLAELQAAGTRDFAGLSVAVRELGNLG